MKRMRLMIWCLLAVFLSGGASSCDSPPVTVQQEETIVDSVQKYASDRAATRARQAVQLAYTQTHATGIVDDGNSLLVICFKPEEKFSTDYERERTLNARLEEWRKQHLATVILNQKVIQWVNGRENHWEQIGLLVEYLHTDTVQVR